MMRRSTSVTGRNGLRTLASLLAAVAAVCALAGCDALPKATPADSPGSQRGESGVTVFGDIDMGVGGVRNR